MLFGCKHDTPATISNFVEYGPEVIDGNEKEIDENQKSIHFEGHLSTLHGNRKRQRHIEKITVFTYATRCSFSGDVDNGGRTKCTFFSEVIQETTGTNNLRKFFFYQPKSPGV